MTTNIIKIGNSKGLILNKAIIAKYGFEGEVSLRLEDDHLVIESLKKPREGWSEMFQKENSLDDHERLLPDVFDDEELLEW